jgi:hypothetical protein
MLLRSRSRMDAHVASGRERLLMLADFVETLPAERLSLTRWFGFGKGCAVAWAATDPWFRAQGLRLEEADSVSGCRPEYRRRLGTAAGTGAAGRPHPRLPRRTRGGLTPQNHARPALGRGLFQSSSSPSHR